MKEQMSRKFESSKELKDRLVHMVMCKGVNPKSLVKKYDLPHVNTLLNWVTIYKKSLEKGAVTLPVIQKSRKGDIKILKGRIKQLEKALEKSNVKVDHALELILQGSTIDG